MVRIKARASAKLLERLKFMLEIKDFAISDLKKLNKKWLLKKKKIKYARPPQTDWEDAEDESVAAEID